MENQAPSNNGEERTQNGNIRDDGQNLQLAVRPPDELATIPDEETALLARKKRRRSDDSGALVAVEDGDKGKLVSDVKESGDAKRQKVEPDTNNGGNVPSIKAGGGKQTMDVDEHGGKESEQMEVETYHDVSETAATQMEHPTTNHQRDPPAAPPQHPTITVGIEPSNPVKSTATVSTMVPHQNGSIQPSRQMEHISKLRMPSKYTPGKMPPETTRLKNTPYDASNKQSKRMLFDGTQETSTTEQKQTSMHETPRVHDQKRRWNQHEPQGDFPECNDDEGAAEEDSGSEKPPRVSPLARGDVWFILLLMLQVFFWPTWINPILTGVMDASDSLVLFYKEKAGVAPKVIENITKVERVTYIKKKKNETPPLPLQVNTLKIKEDIADISQLLESLEHSISSLDDKDAELEEEIISIEAALDDQLEFLASWETAVRNTESSLKSVIAGATSFGSKQYLPRLVKKAVASVGKLNDLTALEMPLTIIDTFTVPLWATIAPECPKAPVVDDDPIVHIEEVGFQLEDIQELAANSVSSISSDPESTAIVREWVRSKLDELLSQQPVRESAEVFIGLSESDVREAIADRLEIELADQNGLVDFASIQAGAQIIRSGTRATSPSFVETLPLLNRLMAAVRVRFYGHGPEAALTPTHPRDALGQCWAFENIAKSKNPRWRNVHLKDPSNGEFATLTIRLPKPMRVASVVIEHASKEATKQPSSAILDFRVIGYVDADASGNPLPLGVFRYDIGAQSPIQDFEVNSEISGRPAPSVQSVTLAIDSNWGFDYACLYRFRVHEKS